MQKAITLQTLPISFLLDTPRYIVVESAFDQTRQSSHKGYTEAHRSYLHNEGEYDLLIPYPEWMSDNSTWEYNPCL